MNKRNGLAVIGLLGGMSWESTATYYRLINEGVRKHLGGLNSAELVVRSVNFGPIACLQQQESWKELADLLSEEAKRLEDAGSDYVLLCTNTMHFVAEEIKTSISVPFIHIADGVGEYCRQKGVKKVGLLGTRYTMEKSFYSGWMESHFGVESLVPEVEGRSTVHNVIYEELCQGIVRDQSRQKFIEIAEDLERLGAEAIVLGCTEIGMILSQKEMKFPVLDSTTLHADMAVRRACGDMAAS